MNKKDEENTVIHKINGWVQLNDHVVYDNPWIRIHHQDVQRPNGSKGIYGVVHFKNRAVGIIPLDDEGNTWLVRQTRYALNMSTWEIPEGGAPLHESTLNAAKRELEEEVGLKADTWHELMALHTTNSVSDEEGIIYVARNLHLGVQQLEDTEDIEVRKLPLTEAIDMVKNGDITDAISVAGLLRLAIDLPV